MKINKVKISELPSVDKLRGFSTIGVGPDGASYKASLDKVQDVADAANEAAQNASDAAASANTAAEGANTAAGRVDSAIRDASSATTAANAAATSATNAAKSATTATTQADIARNAANTAASQAETARDAANTAAGNVNDAIKTATTATNEANSAAADARTATTAANSAKDAANSAATSANEASEGATQAAIRANTAAEAAETAVGGMDGVFARLASPAFSGTPTAPTPNVSDASTKIATTNYVFQTASNKIVYVADFETLNPNASLTDSITGKTFTLRQGESCQFYSSYDANGKPSMGYKNASTGTISNDALSTIYYWSGTITRINSTYYMVTAYGNNSTVGGPQMATRLYYGSSRYEWVISTEYANQSTNGYVKLPSGIMIAWGYSASTSANRTITFPVAFRNVYSIATSVKCATNSLHVGAAQIVSTGTTTINGAAFINNVEFRCYAISNGGSGSGGTTPMYWIAIGAWK